jgi:acyl-coenzyme A synthetase/AMP-(fatty) acid ligase
MSVYSKSDTAEHTKHHALYFSLHMCVQVSSVELERVVLANVPGVAEAAAVGVAAPGGGPELLHMFLVLNPSAAAAAAAAGKASGSSRSSAAIEAAADAVKQLQQACQAAVRAHLNPLFKVERVLLVPSLPRTASNKVMRRVLRSQAMQQRAKL